MSVPYSLVVASAVRDCASYLPDVFKNIERISKEFDDVKVIFVESDSSDDTLSVLNSIKKSTELPVEIVSLGKLQNEYPRRTDRIAFARNVYLDIVERMVGYDYLLVIDADDISAERMNIEGVMSCFDYEDWDMMTANQPQGYYDLWALRHKELMPYDCWKKVMNRPSDMTYQEAVNNYVNKWFIKIDEDQPLIKVDSSFGGSAFIRIDSIRGCRHIGHNEDGTIACEWPSFCSNLDNIFINPKFVNSTILSEHVKANMMI